MRKFLSILLLLVFFVSQVGYYFIYTFQQYQIKEAVKKQMLAYIPDSSLELIVAEENNSFRWEEEGKEFYQDGQLYDVVKTVRKNNTTILYCINDKKEKELLLHLGKAVKAANSKGAKQNIPIQIMDLMVEDISPTANINPALTQQYFYFDSAIIAFTKKVNAPPPRA